DPEGAEEEEKKRLEAEERAAMRNRYLRLIPDHHGSHRIDGKLPDALAITIKTQLDAFEPSQSSYGDTGESPTPEMRRADALMRMVDAAASTTTTAAGTGGRARVQVILDYDTLITGLGRVELPGMTDVDALTATEARRLACDAGIIPMVLGSAGQPLDVGREHRLVTPAIWDALVARDRGCAFPSCTARPASCHAHHIIPWWARGITWLGNLVLLCPHHHRLVEPDPHRPAHSQWQVHLDPTTGLPWFTPPRNIDPHQKPRQHQNHVLRALTPTPKAPPRPPTNTPPQPPPTPRPDQTPQQTPAPVPAPERDPNPWHPDGDPPGWDTPTPEPVTTTAYTNP
ncbi:DUF222 domain-containing protein, partial [Tessaracoccus lubricantis]